MTITEQDIEFFREAKRIQNIVKAGHGSWVYRPEGFHPRRQLISEAYPMRGPGDIVLPRLDQLIEMAAKIGLWELIQCEWGYWAKVLDSDKHTTHGKGPTPSIALGKCLLEVLGD